MIRYDILTQEALRSVLRKVLDEVALAGLPGNHHFFIGFDTRHPGVRLSGRMRGRYPENMTIVIQHTFWNLQTSDTGFEVDLTFDDIRERLRIPYAAIRSFFDPSAKFGLQFNIKPPRAAEDNPEVIEWPDDDSAAPAAKPARTAEGDGRGTIRRTGSGGNDAAIAAAADNGGEVVSLDSFRKKK